jgi:DivIVA domain-containing protein
MRLSPLDIQHMEFQRTASGYHRRQVREFLERVAMEREELLRDVQNLREELDLRNEQITELQAAEAELRRSASATRSRRTPRRRRSSSCSRRTASSTIGSTAPRRACASPRPSWHG